MVLEDYRSMGRGTKILLLVLSAFISFCGIFGMSYVFGRGWPLLDLYSELLLSLLCILPVGLGLVAFDALVFKGLARQSKRDLSRAAPSWLDRVSPQWSFRSIALFALIMMLFWLPWYIANFPGSTYWDTYYQMYQVYPENHPIAVIPWEEIYHQTLTDAWLVDHHPIFTTLVYGAFGWVSDQLTGTWMAGVALFCTLQGLLHILAFTASTAYLRKVGCPRAVCFGIFVFFCIFPPIPTWSLCMVKDSFFGLFFIPYFMMLFEILRTKGTFLRRPRSVVLFILCALLLCLTKKTGIFVVVSTGLAATVLWRKQHGVARAFLLQAALPFVVVSLLFPLVLFPALNIQSGGKQEVLGPLFQQTARYVLDHGEEVTPEEKDAIAAVIDYDRLADQYAYDFEDAVKYRFDLEATDEEIGAYLATYIAQGFKHPDSYFAALMSLAGFYVAPTAYVNIRMVTVDTKMGDDHRYMLWNPEELTPLRQGMDEAYKTVANIPGFNVPLLIVTYVLWLPSLLFFMAKRRGLHCGVLFIPSLILLGFCVIAPVYDARYAVPLFDIAPLLLGAVLVLLKGRITSRAPREIAWQRGVHTRGSSNITGEEKQGTASNYDHDPMASFCLSAHLAP